MQDAFFPFFQKSLKSGISRVVQMYESIINSLTKIPYKTAPIYPYTLCYKDLRLLPIHFEQHNQFQTTQKLAKQC